MPSALPVAKVSMNYASVVLIDFGAISAACYFIHARKGKNSYASPSLTRTDPTGSLQRSTRIRWSLNESIYPTQPLSPSDYYRKAGLQ